MRTYRALIVGALLAGFVVAGCGGDPDRPPPISDDLGGSVVDALADIGVISPRDAQSSFGDGGATGDGQVANYDVTGAQDVGRGDDGATAMDAGVSPGLDGGVPVADNGVTTGPTDNGVTTGPTDNGVTTGPTDNGVTTGPVDTGF